MTNPNDPAFPILESKLNASWPGLTKREYCAAMAMQGLLVPNEFQKRNAHWEADVAYNAICLADALIAALNKKKPAP